MLFKELCYSWLDFKRCSVKLSTVSTYTRTIGKHIIPAFGHLECSNIEEKDIVKYIHDLTKEKLSHKTIQDIVVIIKSILKYGNMMQVTHLTLELIPCPRVINKQTEALTMEEVQRVMLYMKEHPSYKNIGIYLSLYTGMRLGEVCALKWEDINLKEHKIFITKTMQRIYNDYGSTEVIITEPKTHHSLRVIPISDFLFEILKKEEKHQGYVLAHKCHHIEPRTLQKYFQNMMDELNISFTNFHILRHTFATQCIQCNVDVKSLSEMLGHASVNMTLNRYVHSSFDTKKSQIMKLKYESKR